MSKTVVHLGGEGVVGDESVCDKNAWDDWCHHGIRQEGERSDWKQDQGYHHLLPVTLLSDIPPTSKDMYSPQTASLMRDQVFKHEPVRDISHPNYIQCNFLLHKHLFR